jgi:DUF4097 and DUF4098 domain-containing protein YvlB
MFIVLALAAIPFAYDGALRPGQTLTIRDVNGEVRVRTGDRLAIRATKHAERSDPNEVAIKVENRAGGIVVCVRYPPEANRGCDEQRTSRDGNNSDTAVDFDITVPHGVTVNAQTVNGSLDVTNDGITEAQTVNGSVRVEGRDVRSAHTVNGSVHVRILDGRGSLTAKTVNGSIDVSLPRGTGVELAAHTLTGSINAEGVDVRHPRYGPGARANATVGDGARKLALETVNGSITVNR